MNLKHQLIIICLALLTACSTKPVDLQGMWVSDNNRDVVLFRNDSMYCASSPFKILSIEGNRLITESTNPFIRSGEPATTSVETIQFSLDNDLLFLDHEYYLKGMKKSQFDNLFDHKVNKHGIKLELINGVSNNALPSKTYFDFIQVGIAKDSSIGTVFNGTMVSLDSLAAYYLYLHTDYEYTKPDCALAVDNDILFEDYYKKIYRAIIPNDSSYIRVYHAIHAVPEQTWFFPRNPWEQVSYQKYSRHLLESEAVERGYDYSITTSLGVNTEGGLLVNGQLNKEEDLKSRLYDLYWQNTKEAFFGIEAANGLTYGNYLLFVSTVIAIAREERDKYAYKHYGESFDELNSYGTRTRGIHTTNDSIANEIIRLYPSRILVKDNWN